jgi:HPt (histidine-containing phosphotransfer) domain-containing protein
LGVNWGKSLPKTWRTCGRCTKRSVNHFRDWLAKTSLPGQPVHGVDFEIWIIAVPLHLERIDWMPSPPLAPDDGPIDIAHLKRMTLGDAGLEREVLAMFSAQAVGLIGMLADLPSDAGALAHKLQGSARGIGAFRVADAAESLESALLSGADAAQPLAELNEALAQVRAAIDAILRRS